MFEISEGPPEFGVYLGDGSEGGWSIGQSVEHCESMDGAEVANSSYPHARFGQLSGIRFSFVAQYIKLGRENESRR
jgi:hypothetical protein